MIVLYLIIFFVFTFISEIFIVRYEIKKNIELFYDLYKREIIKVLKKEGKI